MDGLWGRLGWGGPTSFADESHSPSSRRDGAPDRVGQRADSKRVPRETWVNDIDREVPSAHRPEHRSVTVRDYGDIAQRANSETCGKSMPPLNTKEPKRLRGLSGGLGAKRLWHLTHTHLGSNRSM